MTPNLVGYVHQRKEENEYLVINAVFVAKQYIKIVVTYNNIQRHF